MNPILARGLAGHASPSGRWAPRRPGHAGLARPWQPGRLLLVALTNPAALDALRRFWANWHSEAKRVNVIDDRKLIDRVARMTVNGPLAAFAVYDRHAVHPGDVALKLSAQRQVAAAATGAPVPAHLAAPGTQASATVDLTEMSAEQRLDSAHDQRIRDERPVASPRHRLGAHDRGLSGRGEGDQFFDGRRERVRLHVVRIPTKRFVAPSEVH